MRSSRIVRTTRPSANPRPRPSSRARRDARSTRDLVEKFLVIVQQIPEPPRSEPAPAASGAQQRQAVGRPATGLVAADVADGRGRAERAREHHARQSGDARPVRSGRGHGHAAERGRYDGAAGLEADAARAGVVVGAVSLRRGHRHQPVRVRDRPRFGSPAPGRGAVRRRRHRLDGPPQGGRSSTRALARTSRPRACPPAPRRSQSMVAFPLEVRDRFIGALAAYHVEPDHFTRRASAHAGPRVGAGRQGRAGRAGLRADSLRLADRLADRAGQLARVHRPRGARDGQGRSAGHAARAPRHRRGPVQGHQRPLRPRRRRPGAARHRHRHPPGGPVLRLLRAQRRRRVRGVPDRVRRERRRRSRRGRSRPRSRH